MVRVTTPDRPPQHSTDESVTRTAPDRRAALRSGVALAAGTLAAGSLTAACATSGAAAHPLAASPASGTPSAAHPAARPAAAAPRRFPGQPAEISHGPRDRPRVALTFHGQGDPAVARTLLGEAERNGARVTVLAVGTWLDEHPDLARRILDGGHDLGNHTLRHLDINAMSEKEADAEIRGCAERLRRLTGSIGTWFRPSRTPRASPAVERLARAAGYPHVLSYDLDSLDYTSPGAAAVTRQVLGGIRNGSVVSLHFGYADTVAALPAVLEELGRRGLRAVTTTELLS
ncbi:polysaccharide deacetylase family protein [Streptomyces sp. me109]|uniref:polysaccharide deacetylase family protein n=1 Tax=Streptomyces sp. me109 TaxID=1827853 RepID=UPI0011CE2268|nr:polysaccharide deacetylase family protein [Streptomyces sp. me109]TXS73302.1 polysaccharide deacetylase family protein [Streptomyces sp. me109]